MLEDSLVLVSLIGVRVLAVLNAYIKLSYLNLDTQLEVIVHSLEVRNSIAPCVVCSSVDM